MEHETKFDESEYETKFDGSTDITIRLGGEGNPQSIAGYFLGVKITKSVYGEGKLYIFKTEAGTVGVWGKAKLNTLLTEDLRGCHCRVTFTGMIAPKVKGRQPSYGYKVLFSRKNRIDVSNIDLSASSTEDDEVDAENYDLEAINEDVSYKAPVAPKKPVTSPDAARQAQLKALLNGRVKA